MPDPHPVLRRALGVLAASAALVLLIAGPASAHVTVSPTDAPAGGYRTVELSVPHGCEGEPTEELTVQLSEQLQSVKAEAVPGWEVSYVREELDEPFESHGATITEYVSTITWTSTGDPLPDDQFLTFGISARWPDAAGEDILIPAVQRCPGDVESSWIDEDPESDHPAPRVTIVAGSDGHGIDADLDADDETAAGDTPTAASGSTDDGSSNGLAIAALIVGIAALATAGYATVAARRS